MITFCQPTKSVLKISPQKSNKPQYVSSSVLSQTNLNKTDEAIQYLREFYENDHLPVSELVNNKILSHLNDLLKLQKYPQIQHQVLWILINMALKYKKYVKQVVGCQCIDDYANLLKNSSSYPIIHHILWILGMIAGHSIVLRDKIMKSTLDYISAIIESEFDVNLRQQYGELPHQYTKVIAISAFVIYRFCNKGNHNIQDKKKLLNIIEYLLIKYGKTEEKDNKINDIIEIRSQTVWSIFTLIINEQDYDTQFINILCNQGILKKLLNDNFIYSNHDHIVDGIIRIFIYILKYKNISKWQHQLVLDLLSSMRFCMNKYIKLYESASNINININTKQIEIIQELCWLIAKIASDSIKTVKLLNDNGLLTLCIKLMRMNDIALGKYALIAVRDAIFHDSDDDTGNNEENIDYLVENELIEALCEYGQINYNLIEIGDESIRNVLDCIELIFTHYNNDNQVNQVNQHIELLRLSGGLQLLYLIKQDVDNGVFTLNEWKANNIINKYFYVQNIKYSGNKNNNWFAFDMEYVKNLQ